MVRQLPDAHTLRSKIMNLKAEFDQIGKFINRDGDEQNAKKAHFVFGKKGDVISGGFYMPVGMEFPKEGITITLLNDTGFVPV
jgi:nitrogenase subunit NifH